MTSPAATTAATATATAASTAATHEPLSAAWVERDERIERGRVRLEQRRRELRTDERTRRRVMEKSRRCPAVRVARGQLHHLY
jgi:hypothetical protein